MADDALPTRLQRLAVAKEKLKKHQERHGTGAGKNHNNNTEDISSASTATSVASNLSERSESEQNLNSASSQPVLEMTSPLGPTAACFFTETSGAGDYFIDPFSVKIAPAISQAEPCLESATIGNDSTSTSTSTELGAIQVLIAEKAQLTKELNKHKNVCRERELELEELRTQYASATKRIEELQDCCSGQVSTMESLRKNNAELQHKLAQTSALCEDKQTHIDELQQQMAQLQTRYTDEAQKLNEKSSELDMAQLRLRQLSDESNVSADHRVETLTQTVYMYEQQIRDLQAMVQQLTKDKEQAQGHYQNYVQHLNSEFSKLNERNSELSAESARLQERERQLIEHVGSLEKEIQRNISKQAQLSAQSEEFKMAQNAKNNIPAFLNELGNTNTQQQELLAKLNAQDEHIQALQTKLNVAERTIEELQAHIERIETHQPDTGKLLATMQSDKVAASRAVTQNIEMKQQLDELQQRFVQLTNEKAELVNKVDSEAFTGRQLHAERDEFKDKFNALDERFKLKDAEMIRLSHENMELLSQNRMLLQQLSGRTKRNEVRDPRNEGLLTGKRSEDKDDVLNADHEHKSTTHEHDQEHQPHQPHQHHQHHLHDQHNEHIEDQRQQETDEQQQQHQQQHIIKPNERLPNLRQHIFESKSTSFDDSEISSGIEGKEEYDDYLNDEHEHDDDEACTEHNEHNNHHDHNYVEETTVHGTQMPTEYALQKLQTRFSRLMAHVADLTEDKQRLEHLVMQLQGETETIGEYVTLYQTQRRMLKQREYEKAAQMAQLKKERELLREKINQLNGLVSTLGVAEMSTPATTTATTSTMSTSDLLPNTESKVDSATQPKQILGQIQGILSELEENATKETAISKTAAENSRDHLNCCLGKIEVV